MCEGRIAASLAFISTAFLQCKISQPEKRAEEVLEIILGTNMPLLLPDFGLVETAGEVSLVETSGSVLVEGS